MQELATASFSQPQLEHGLETELCVQPEPEHEDISEPGLEPQSTHDLIHMLF